MLSTCHTVSQQGNSPRQTRLLRHSHGRVASTLTKSRLNRNPLLPAAASEVVYLAGRDDRRQFHS